MNFFVKVKDFIFKHKIISGIIVLCLLGGGYWWYSASTNTSGVTRYVLAAATNGTIISSVSGTGQVSASNQIDIKPEVSGKIVYINIPKDQAVNAGTLLAQIDSQDAQKTVQSAENDLATAELSTQDVNGNAKDALDLSYSNGLNALTTTYNDLTSMKANLDAMFLQSSYNGNDDDIDYYINLVRFYDSSSSSELNYWTVGAKQTYTNAQNKLDTVEATAWTLSKNSPPSQIEDAINQSSDSVTAFLDLIRQTSDLVQRYQKVVLSKSLTTPIKSTITTSQATQLSSALASLISDTNALLTAKSDITAKEQAFSQVGVNTQSQNLNILQYQNALADAKDNLSKYYIYAPIDGTISASDTTVNVGDTVSSGAVLGSIVTNQEIIEISLNEVDIVKIKNGEKVTITFDALPNVTVTGHVADIDTVGTVTQGVVSYGVKISLDITESQIKPGMSGSVNIITDTQQDILTVPNSAVKTRGGANYVLVLNSKQDLTSPTASQGFISEIAPTQKAVVIGVTDDTNTQITSGLSEGDQVVVRTISATAAATSSSTRTTSATSATRLITGGGGGGGFGGGRPGN